MDVFETARAMAWSRVPVLIDEYLEKTAQPAKDLQRSMADIYTYGDVGVYWHPLIEEVGLLYRGPEEKRAQDVALATEAVQRLGRPVVGMWDSNVRHDHSWVKVAYSPTLRRAGELLNFYPGEYIAGYPNSPSPLAATLTSGLVGAGLGYGAGWLGEKLLPSAWTRGRLRRTLALAGAAGLSIPGLLWMYSNRARGKGMWDGSDLNIPRPGEPGYSGVILPAEVRPPASDFRPWEADPEFAKEKLGTMYKGAIDHFIKEAWGEPEFQTMGGFEQGRSPYDVNIDRLGRTLWDVGADPRTTATTMGAVYAAQQLPDPRGRPGYATPQQTGLLGTMMGAAGGGAKGYATGWLVGKALGLLTGMPEGTQNVLKNTGAVLGIVDAVVPRLFGR
jgi:hypothetical protein